MERSIVGVSAITTASEPVIFSFFETIANTSGAGLDSSGSSEEAVMSTNFVMPAMSRNLSSSSLFAGGAMAIRSPASRTRCSRSGTA